MTGYRPVLNRGRPLADPDHVLDLSLAFAARIAAPRTTHRALRTKVLYQLFLKRTAGLNV
jgi:hypothetical protein